MPAAQSGQKTAKMAAVPVPKALAIGKVWHAVWGCKSCLHMPWGCLGQGPTTKSTAASCSAKQPPPPWTCAFFWAGRHFTEISFFGRPACHLANVLAPKVGCALKCAAWTGDPTLKQHPKASSGLWSMGLEMANSVAIAADDKFIQCIKKYAKKMHPTNECTQNHLPQPHATTCMCWLPPQGAFEIFDFCLRIRQLCLRIRQPLWAPWAWGMFGPLCWPPVARVGKHMLGAVVSMCGHCAMHLVAHCQHVLAC